MGGLFGGGNQTVSTSAPRIGSMRVQTSAFGMAIPIIYGKTRVSANLIGYYDFTAIPHTSSQSQGGKGGGGVTSTNTTYTYTAALMMGLGEGLISAVGVAWKSKEKTTAAALGFSHYTGSYTQTAWPYLTTNHPSQALSYRGLSFLAASAYDLGDNADLANHNFVVNAILNYSPDGISEGAKIESILPDLLTNAHYGAGFPSANIGSLSQAGSYALAAGIILSPVYSEQRPANESIDELAQSVNSAVVWSEGQLKLLPYSDTAISGAWGNYTPSNPVLYALNDDDFIASDGSDPVRVTRSTQADAFNKVTVEYIDSANDYNIAVVEATDQANIEQYGLRPKDPVKLHLITHAKAARTVAQNILQRVLYIRNIYEFTVGIRYALLEPMDVVSISDANLGLSAAPVRIIEIEETQDGQFNIRAEEMPDGVSHSAQYPTQSNAGYAADFNVAPGNANAPVIFEPPTSLSVDPQIWLATSGGVDWGGCEVWVSRDNTTYTQVGVINSPARHGTASLANGTDPDTTHTMAVDVSVSRATLLGGTLADRDQMNTLCYVGGELVSYQSAALTSAYHYNMTSLRRGAYGSVPSAHAAGSAFARLDSAIFKYNYDPAMIGSPLYIKLRSFNIYGLAKEDLAGLTPITYNVVGSYLGAISGLALAQAFTGRGVKVKWDAYTGASSYKVEIWQSGALKRTVNGVASTGYEYTFEDMLADGGPWRSVDIKVYAVSPNSTTLSAATMTVSNPQAATPTGLFGTAGALSATVGAAKSTDTDYAGMLVFGASTTGFTPDTTTWTNLLYDGAENSHTFTGMTGGVPMYYRVAYYDQYGKDNLNITSEISVTPLAAGGVRIVSALPASGIEDGEVVSLTTDHKLYRWDAGTSAWVTWVDGSDILAASITTGKLAAGSVLAGNIDVTTLSAVSAMLGTISSGNITLDSTSYIRGGKTAFSSTGAGFFLGYDSTAYKFNIGDATRYFKWDGSTMSFSGTLVGSDGTFSGTLTASAVNAVNTVNIAGNAVTIPTSSYVSGAYSVPTSGTLTQICSLTYTSVGSNVFISVGFTVSATSTTGGYGELRRNGVAILPNFIMWSLGSNGRQTVNFVDTPPSGTVTYSFHVSQNDGSLSVSQRSILTIETKK